jgi:hypothetical protein
MRDRLDDLVLGDAVLQRFLQVKRQAERYGADRAEEPMPHRESPP